MEEKLKKYRQEKKKNIIRHYVESISGVFSKTHTGTLDNVQEAAAVTNEVVKPFNVQQPSPCVSKDRTKMELSSWYQWTIRGLKAILWIMLLLIFSEYHFGAVFFIVSLFYFVYKTLDDRPRNGRQLSAYSVFNPKCERIEGTFTSEQFEKQMFRGGL